VNDNIDKPWNWDDLSSNKFFMMKDYILLN